MLYLQNKRRHGNGNLKKDLLLGHLQPLKDKNSKHLAVLFDSVLCNFIGFCMEMPCWCTTVVH